MRKITLFLTGIFSLLIIYQSPAKADDPYQLPVIDSPYNFDHNAYNFSSMNQSMNLTLDFYYLGHHYLGLFAKHNNYDRLYNDVAFDFLSLYLPFGSSWVHEEYHRAIMLNRGIDSYDEVWDFKFFQSITKVSHVSDQQLSDFKADHPAEFARMSAAGMEAQTQMNLDLEKNKFYYGARDGIVVEWLNATNNTFYLKSCTDQKVATSLDQSSEPTERERDFTGLDCLGWVYDMHRPYEAYSARGPHPTGTGIARYIYPSDLTADEKSYLEDEVKWSLFNFVDPMMFAQGPRQSHLLNSDIKWTWNFKHYLTSFGNSIDFNLFAQVNQTQNWYLSLHNYFNKSRYMPGLEVQLLRAPAFSDRHMSLRAMIWEQPRDELFLATAKRWGGLWGTSFYFKPHGGWQPYVELEAKTAGWVAGSPYLAKNFTARIGAAYMMSGCIDP